MTRTRLGCEKPAMFWQAERPSARTSDADPAAANSGSFRVPEVFRFQVIFIRYSGSRSRAGTLKIFGLALPPIVQGCDDESLRLSGYRSMRGTWIGNAL